MNASPVWAWHLVLLPAVLAANYLVMTARHEAAHAVVVLAFGGEIAAVHLWPPRGGTLSWITFRLPLDAPARALPLQAVAPLLTALALLAAGTWGARRLRPGMLRANVVVTAVLVPAAEIVALALGYWHGGSDLVHVLGAPTPTLRWGVLGGLGGAAAATTALALWRVCVEHAPPRLAARAWNPRS